MEKRTKETKKQRIAIISGLIVLEISLLFLLSSLFSIDVKALVGNDNVTVPTQLSIGNSFPEVINITINNVNPINLAPNTTTQVNVIAIIRDFNGESDISAVTSEFFDNSASFYGDGDDNNHHYTNNTCTIDTSYGDGTEINATCTFNLEYYANNATWNATIFVNDSLASSSIGSETETINTLLALALPDTIDYGLTNASSVSGEQIANVTNMGNVIMNLTLSSYAATEGDGLAMNCTLGSTQNISAGHEKYNLTNSISGTLTLQEFEANYTNITTSPVTNAFNLNPRQNDAVQYIEETNSTYWRIYVPLGVAGSCSGNIIFGAIQSPAS